MGISHTSVIVPTLPNMWQQTDANAAYGIRDIHSYEDIRAQTPGDAPIDDEAIFRFSATQLSTDGKPFFTMVLSLSTHSPYDEYCGPDLFGSCASLPREYKNYLNTCHFTDQWLTYYFDALKQKGLYEHSLIVICADHHAHLDRLGMSGRITDHTPLFIVNGNFDASQSWQGECHQLDTFTTIADLLCLEKWHGLGHTLLNPHYDDSANEQAYEVSKLIIQSGFFPVK